MISGDTYWVHLRVIFDLIVIYPGCQGFDVSLVSSRLLELISRARGRHKALRLQNGT